MVAAHYHCLFCRIVANEVPAILLAVDEHALALMDAGPLAPGHAVVIARTHVETIFDISEPVLNAAMDMVKRVAAAVQETFEPDGMTLIQGNGFAAGQTVRHFHVHILPRSENDLLMMNWHPHPGDRHVIEDAAIRIRRHIR